MLLPLVRSRQHPYTNLQNQITMWIRFSHLQYKTEINQKLFGVNLEEIPICSETRVFIIDGAKEKLHSPSCNYFMNRTEMPRLKAYYITALNKHANQLMVIFLFCFIFVFILKNFYSNNTRLKLITNSVRKYGKLQTEYGLVINSKLSNRKGDVARTNFCIAVCTFTKNQVLKSQAFTTSLFRQNFWLIEMLTIKMHQLFW